MKCFVPRTHKHTNTAHFSVCQTKSHFKHFVILNNLQIWCGKWQVVCEYIIIQIKIKYTYTPAAHNDSLILSAKWRAYLIKSTFVSFDGQSHGKLDSQRRSWTTYAASKQTQYNTKIPGEKRESFWIKLKSISTSILPIFAAFQTNAISHAVFLCLLFFFLSFYYSSYSFTFPFHFSCTFILYVASLKVIWFWFLGKCSFVQSFCNIDFFFCPFHWITELRMETIITFIFFSCEKYGEQKNGERERKQWFPLYTTEWY